MGVIQFEDGVVGPRGPQGVPGNTGPIGPTGALFPSTIGDGEYIQDNSVRRVLENVAGNTTLAVYSPTGTSTLTGDSLTTGDVVTDTLTLPYDTDAYYLYQQELTGVHAGDMLAATWNVRKINAIQHVGLSPDIVLSGTTGFTINSSGLYKIWAEAPAFEVDGHQLRLHDGTATVTVGGSSYSQAAHPTTTRSFLFTTLNVTAPATYQLQHYSQAAELLDGQGFASASGEAEIYTQVIIHRLS